MADREDPRLSINKLGEYMTARAGRRRKILHDAKYPSSFIVPRYRDFYEIAPRYLQSNPLDDDIVYDAVTELEGRNVDSEWQEQNVGLNIDLLIGLVDVADEINIEDYTVKKRSDSQERLVIEGVAISVRPELELAATIRRRDIRGAIKFYLPKTNPLDQDSADYISSLLYQYSSTHYDDGDPVDYRHCYVLDIPSRRIYTAPRAFIRRMNDIEAACQEIAMIWPAI